MVCFMYRRGFVGKMTWILLSRNRAVCICVCVRMEPSGMKHWSQGSTQETWMILVSMFSSLDQQDNLLKTWCVHLVLYYSGAQIPFIFTVMVSSFLCRSTESAELAAYSKEMEFVSLNNPHGSSSHLSLVVSSSWKIALFGLFVYNWLGTCILSHKL